LLQSPRRIEFVYTPTGVKGVDKLLSDLGVPQGYIIYLLGAPGSGKTTFAMQFLHHGAKFENEPGVYVSLDEHPAYLRAHAREFGWDLEGLEASGKLALLDGSPIRSLPGETKLGSITIGKRDFSLVSLIKWITEAVKKIGAKRLVIDPTAVFSVQYTTESDRRFAVMELLQAISQTGCTTLLVSELSHTSLDRTYQFEEFLAQGVIIMRKIIRSGGVTRVFTIDKMRVIDHDTQPHPYRITQTGIEVFPTELAIP